MILRRGAPRQNHPGGKYRAGRERFTTMSALSLEFGSARLVRAQQRTVRAGLIGCGAFGSGILAQSGSVPLLEVPAVADRLPDAARRAYERAGVPDEAIVVCDGRPAALRAIETGKRVIVADPM